MKKLFSSQEQQEGREVDVKGTQKLQKWKRRRRGMKRLTREKHSFLYLNPKSFASAAQNGIRCREGERERDL